MRILLTGHRGFIGSYLVPELHRARWDVIGHDRTDGDMLEKGVFRNVLLRNSPDMVVHLAAQVGRLFNEDDPDRAIRANAVMTTLVARACGESDTPLTYVSTSEVYGDHGEMICDEETPCDGKPSGIYALSKRWGEDLCQLYAPAGLRIIRPTMPYGPGTPPGRGRRAIDNFLWFAHHGNPLPVHRGAERSWCHAVDVARGMRLVMEAPPGVYNVGRDDDPRKMIDVARLACQIAGRSPDLVQEIDPPSLQTVVKRLSTRKLANLGFRPSISLEDGMPELYAWIRSYDEDVRWRLSA